MGAEEAEVTVRRFAILTHDHPFFHWDLLLEAGEVAWTWRLLDEPRPDRTLRAQRIGDHRLLYLDYEGPVSEGRGQVARWDTGTYRIEDQTPGQLTVCLSGNRGELRLSLPSAP
jgi:DNA polymerase Ligase (LigD)